MNDLGHSRVPTGQLGPRTAAVAAALRRHLAHPWRRDPSPERREHFSQIEARVRGHAGPVLLDAGCGTGRGVLALARLRPDALVIGVDKSASRLAKAPLLPDNAALYRAELADLFVLAAVAGLRFETVYLLYPNPWPKPAHLTRRWHGHPCFPDLLEVSEAIELRTNWRPYAQEVAHGLRLALGDRETVHERPLVVDEPLTAFEAKYRASDHLVWQVCASSRRFDRREAAARLIPSPS